MTIASRYLAKIEDTLKGSGAHLVSGGRIAFFHNTAKNMPM